MKRVLAWIGIALGVVGLGFGLVAAQYEAKTPSGTKIGEIPIGDMTREQASFRIRSWWEQEKSRAVRLSLPTGQTYEDSASKFGIAVDDEASVAQIDFDSFWDVLRKQVSGTSELARYELKFKSEVVDSKPIELFVERNIPERQPARVRFNGATIERIPEVAGFKLDRSKLAEAALASFHSQGPSEMPLVIDQKKVPDEELDKITEVMSEFSTRFSEGKASRSSNIRLAARKIDGIVLAPGESFSFNKTVGKRTREAGFREAGVYKDGKHDIDLGGGICQVSTTLYNAALFANLKINRRQNHSMPVPYVPIGRDAAVDYGSIDLSFQNTLDIPIAVNASVSTGKITFRILGMKDPGLAIKIESSDRRSWAVGEKVQPDPSLPAGKRKVIEKGSSGHSINTYRVVYKDGVEVKREALGRSHYRGGVRIVAVGVAQPLNGATEDVPEVPETTIDSGSGLN